MILIVLANEIFFFTSLHSKVLVNIKKKHGTIILKQQKLLPYLTINFLTMNVSNREA